MAKSKSTSKPTEPFKAIRKAPPDRKTLQTLGEHSYAIPDVIARPISPWKLALALILFPFILTTLFIYTLFILLAPPSLKESWFSKIIPLLMNAMEQRTINQRKLLLQHVSGRVLDIGAGDGPYLQHCTKASHYVALEPMKSLHPALALKAHHAGFQDYQIMIRSDTLETYQSEPELFDWILLPNVLCEVHNVSEALDKVHRMLKTGGHVYFCEHIASPRGTISRRIQDFMNPWWSQISGGCHCNRESLHAMEGMASWDVVSWTFTGLIAAGGPVVMGLARKVEPNV